MKRKHIRQRIGAFFMAAALITMAILQLNTEVYAAGLPDITQYATVDELKTFNTDDTDGSISAAKVYFGENNQEWWIAGSQDDNSLTLFSASSMGKGIQFESNYDINKAYDSSWNCTYLDGNPAEVFPNHYAASYIRNVTLKGLETSFFTGTEQALMNGTTIYTNDTKNNSVYSTTDKLYLAYGDQEDYKYITVGKNSRNGLNEGLRIDPSYWGESVLELFWIRSPFVSNDDPNDGSNVLTAWPSANYPAFNGARTDNASLEHIRPAFELNSSTILFASAVPSATTDGSMTLEDVDGNSAFTLRYASSSLGTAEITYDKSQVNVSNVLQGTYLVVQNSNGAYAKSVSGTQTITAADMNVDSFENCKVWLETTDSNERMTYATMATCKTNYTVKVVENTGLKITSGNAEQVIAIGDEVSTIEIAVQDGYYLLEDYLTNLQGLNGLHVKETDNGFSISGTPTEDVNITLPEATAYKDGNTVIIEPTNLTAVYGKKLSDVSLPQGWVWADGDTLVSVGKQNYFARFDISAYEKEYDFKNVTGYNAQGHYVERSLLVTVLKADSTVAITNSSLDKEYDKSAVSNPDVVKTGSTKDVTFTWYQKDGNDWVKLDKAPVNVGSYKVVVAVQEDDNYNAIETEKTFEITKAVPIYTLPEDLIIKQGEALSTVTLPDGFAWNDSTQIANDLGTQTFKAIFIPEDTTNYQTVEVDIRIKVVSAMFMINRVPVISVEDKTLTVGDTFDPKKDVTAIDKEDGDVTDKIEVIKNNVDTEQSGTYEVTYKVIDSQGASVTKTITVTVKEKKNTQTPNKDNNVTNDMTDKKDNVQIAVKTGDTTNFFAWLTMSIFSAINVLLITLFRRKKQ